MKFSIGSLLNGNQEMPAQKKRVLAIGGVAFIILLFVSFLLSLSEDSAPSSTDEDMSMGNTIIQNDIEGSLQLPSSQRYDFESNGQSVGGGLENLLNDAPAQLGVDNDPFANMPGTGTTPAPQDESDALVPTPEPVPHDEPSHYEELNAAVKLPQAAPATKSTALYCDTYTTKAAAESQKAVLAFQGVGASVITNKDGSFGLKLGPYTSADEARSAFSNLSEKGLLQRCALITN